MKIQYLGHACFKLVSGDNSLVIDPYQDGSVDGLKPLRVEATRVITSHQHADHYGLDCVKIIEGNTNTFDIQTIHSWHDNQHGKLRGANDINIMTCEGFRIAHLGDLGCMPDESIYSALRNVDVLMIPVGGHFTIDGNQAAQIVKNIAPKCTIPMHYRGEGFGYSVLSTVEVFTQNFDEVQKIGDTLELGNDMPKVAIMDFAR